MKPIVRIILVFVILFCVVSIAQASRGISARLISPTGQKVTGNQWLFVIGIDSYLHWPRLKTAVNDAQAIKNVLLKRYHFDPDYLVELYNEDATEKNIIGNLRDLAKRVKKDDSLLIYYAGHGHLDSITKEGAWVPVESGMDEASAWISNHDIKNYLKVDAIKAKHILLISDSCFAGDFFRGKRGKIPEVTDKIIKKAYSLSSRQAITSGGVEPVSDAGFGGNSVFSHFLLEALKENEKPFLIASDFFPRIKAGVIENAEQLPQFGSLKDTGGSQGGEFVLFLKQDNRLQELAVDAKARQNEIEYLKKMASEAAIAHEKEKAEILLQEKKLAEMDASILKMKESLNATSVGSDDSLDLMLAMVEQREEQNRKIIQMQQQREAEEKKRKTKLTALKKEKEAIRKQLIIDDIVKYEKIASSPFGKDIKGAAWKNLIKKHPRSSDVDEGNIKQFKLQLGLKPDIFDNIEWRLQNNMDGTVTALKSGLMWSDQDNGSSINWTNADIYCAEYKGGGYTDWRLPTKYELSKLHEAGVELGSEASMIKLSHHSAWSSNKEGKGAMIYSFVVGRSFWNFTTAYNRVLPVRDIK